MRLIDAEDILVGCVKTGLKEYDTGKEAGIDLVLAIINHLPTIEAKPVVHAHWDEVSGGRIICSNCGNYPLYDYFGRLFLSRSCPVCGALMDNGGHWVFRKAEEYLNENNCGAQMDEPFPQAHENGNHIAEAGKKENKP